MSSYVYAPALTILVICLITLAIRFRVTNRKLDEFHLNDYKNIIFVIPKWLTISVFVAGMAIGFAFLREAWIQIVDNGADLGGFTFFSIIGLAFVAGVSYSLYIFPKTYAKITNDRLLYREGKKVKVDMPLDEIEEMEYHGFYIWINGDKRKQIPIFLKDSSMLLAILKHKTMENFLSN
jgi:hypothetical protein